MSAADYHAQVGVLDDLGRRGSEIYAGLRPILEPAYNNSFVAIHVDSGEYEVARSAPTAKHAIRRRHPNEGQLFIRKIGDEPEYGLAARFLAGQLRSGRSRSHWR
jgi:hypothetical protein